MARVTLRGRSDPMARALGAVDRAARTGQGALLTVTGEPGIGKSAVLAEIVEQAVRAGFAAGSGKAEQGDQIAPGAPLLVALRSGPHPLLPREAFESLAPLYDRPLWLIDRISALLEELAVHGPVLVAIDDLQWVDRLTRFALRVLPARLAGWPVVWAVASRWAPAEPLNDVVAGADAATTVTPVPLGPLTSADIDDMAADRLGRPPSDAVRRVLAGVGGNPFWAVQVLEGLTRRHQRGQGLGSDLAAGVRARLDQVEPEAVALIELAAIWGKPLPAEDAAHLLADVTGGHLGPAVRAAVDEGLLGDADGELFFPHDLVREAVYTDIPPARRRSLHRRCARYVVAGGGSALAAATHFLASAVRNDEEAVVALEQAAGECMVSMPDQAAEFAQRAFALCDEGDPLWVVAGLRSAQTLVDTQREGEALAIADRLLAVATDPVERARIELQACRALWCLGDCDRMERRAAAAQAIEDVDDVLRARLAAIRALAATRTAAAPHAESMAVTARAEGQRVADEYAQRLALVALIETARNEGRHRLALDRFTDLRRLSDTAYEAEEIRTLQHLDLYDDAEAMLAKVREAHGGGGALPSVLYAQMWQDHNLGRFDAAETGATTLLRLADETGNTGFAFNARLVLAIVASHRGEPARAMAHLTSLTGACAASAESPRHRLALAWLHAGTADARGAAEMLRPLLDGADRFRDSWPWSPPWMRVLARVALDAGDRALAGEAARIADLAARRNPGVASLEGTARHVAALLSGDPVDLDDAVRVLRSSPRPMLLADALRDLGEVLLGHGLTDRAVPALVEAAGLYERLGATRDVHVVSKTLRSKGIRHPGIATAQPRPHSGWAALTPTELRVVELIGTGHTNRSAATELGVSPNTVNTHLRAVFRKLDVKSRVQLTIVYRERDAQADATP